MTKDSDIVLEHHNKPILPNVDPILQVSYFLVVGCHVVLNVSQRGCNFMLSMLSYIVQLALMRNNAMLSQPDQKLLSDFCSDVRTPTEHFQLKGKYTSYAVCPNPDCHAVYKPEFEGKSPIAKYPSYCSNKYMPGKPPCGELLLCPKYVGGKTLQVPIKKFICFSFKDWVASLLSRPGFEDMMDGSWSLGDRNTKENELADIFDGEVLKRFKGPNGELFGAGGTEGHYAFSLCVDFFNPFGNKAAGKSTSCGMISLVCLNIPPDIRYKPENMFLAGIIPGPREPPLTAINHYLSCIVDDLIDFWSPGVFFSQTKKYPGGRHVLCALVAVICDLLGARKIGGFAGIHHNYFCSVCKCTLKENGYGDTNYEQWEWRTDKDCREHAARWRSANNKKEATSEFDAAGVRWSELLRLPYFDMSRYIVVDAMHNLFLGLIKTHFEEILGIKPGQQEEPEIALHLPALDPATNLTPNEQKSVRKIWNYLQGPMATLLATDWNGCVKKFQSNHLGALAYVCNQLGLQPHGQRKRVSRNDWAVTLLGWVCIIYISLC